VLTAEAPVDLDLDLDLDLDVDPATLSDAELSERALALDALAARVEAARLRTLAAVDSRRPWLADGYRSTSTWLGHHRRLPLGSCRSAVVLARRLRDRLPETLAAFGEGAISIHHARLLASLLDRPPVAAALAAGGETTLVQEARQLAFMDFARVVAYFAQVVDPDGAEVDADAMVDSRRLHLSQLRDGRWQLDALLDPVSGAALRAALSRVEQELVDHDWREARDRLDRDPIPADLARRPAQRRADALVELAIRGSSSAPGRRRPKPLISVFLGYETFAGRVCELADGTVIAPGLVADLLDEALIERVVFDGPSRILDLGVARRFTGALRRALEIRDRVCTFAGCDEPAERCEGDHRQPYADGGRTNQSNGQLHCGYHNRWRQRRRRPPP
jgi:hypothetical protein